MNFYAAVTIVALSTAAGMFVGDRLYVAIRWWRVLAVAERAERERPDAGLSVLDAPTARSYRRMYLPKRKSFAEHVDDAMDVFDSGDPPDLIDAGRQMQATDPADLLTRFYEETSR